MPKQKLRAYNRYGEGGDILDVAWRAARVGVLTWEETRAVQDGLMPDCAGCGAAHAGKILIEKVGYCEACFRTEIARRMGGRA